MEIQRSNNIHFGAKVMAPASVKAKCGAKWKDLNVNFIKFETGKEEDCRALESIRNLWGKRNLSAGISEEANILGGNAQIYGLTTQTEFSGKVEPDKVLGLISTDKLHGRDTVQIFKIGTNPSYAYAQKRKSRDIKHIATTLIDSFKALAKKKGTQNVVVNYADPEDMKFLSKVGLEPKNKDFVEFI